MKVLSFIFSFVLLAGPAYGATVTANETLQRGAIIQSGDLDVIILSGESQVDVLNLYLGKQLKRTIYAGKTISPAYVGTPVLVKRNSRVNMIYKFGRLEISAWGRALGEGGAGDIISVMNVESRKRVNGVILPSGIIEVRI